MKPTKRDLLKDTIKHIDISKIDAVPFIDAMRDMSFTSRDTANAADILQLMINDKDSTNWLIIGVMALMCGTLPSPTRMARSSLALPTWR